MIDDILHHKSRLQLATSSKQEKLDSLTELGKKIPPRHVMMSTKIGTCTVCHNEGFSLMLSMLCKNCQLTTYFSYFSKK